MTIKNIILSIQNKNLVSFTYNNKLRIGEPHVIGICNNITQLLLWQTGGESSQGNLPGWRRFDLSSILKFVVLEDNFPGVRPPPSGKHAPFDTIISVVK